MKEKIAAFLRQHWPSAANAPLAVVAVVLAAALAVVAVAFLSLWLAKIIGVGDGFIRLVESILSPTVVFVGIIAGSFIWFVNKFSEEISDLIIRLKEIAGAKFRKQRIGAKSDEASTEKSPTPDLVAAGKVKSDAKAKTAETGLAGDSLAEITKKAEKGDAEAQFNLGAMFCMGIGVARNDAEAVKWYRPAAEQGFAPAQHHLGFMYANGGGVERDDAEAAKWCRSAAEQGHAVAQYDLGVIYANGRGVERNDAGAAKWFRLAAEQGHAKAQGNLGAMYHNGKGVAQNFWEAYVWHAIAAGNGHEESAKYRDDDAKLLSAADLAKAQAEAKRRMEEIRRKQGE